MPFHVTIEPVPDDGLTVEAYAEAVQMLKPASVQVDCGGAGLGRVLLASLQARGIPATALEKRPRPTLPEVLRIEELSQQLSSANRELEERKQSDSLELKLLREYKRDVQILIGRLE